MDYFIVEIENAQKLGIPLEVVIEVININIKDVCPIPGVKANLLGVINQRGKLLWLLDLNQLLIDNNNYQKWKNNLTILVSKYQEKQFGLVVKKLQEIKYINNTELQEVDSKTLDANKYFKYLSQIDSQYQLKIINLEAIYQYINQVN